MEHGPKQARALTEARHEIARLERELQQSVSRPPEERRYLLKRLELARSRLQRRLAT
jgi:hypothetical protein